MSQYFESLGFENAQVLKDIFKNLENQFDELLRNDWSEEWFQYILNHEDKGWDYDLLCCNPNVTWKLIQNNPEKFHNWKQICLNPNITWEIVQANPKVSWNYEFLSENINITWDIVSTNPEIAWNFNFWKLLKPYKVIDLQNTIDYILTSYPINYYRISSNIKITWSIITNNQSNSWNYDLIATMLAKSPIITWEVINANPENLFNPYSSYNVHVTWAIVQENIEKHWNYDYLCSNQNITWNHIQTHFDVLNNSDYISLNPNITWNIIDNSTNIEWNYQNLSKNLFTFAYKNYYNEKMQIENEFTLS